MLLPGAATRTPRRASTSPRDRPIARALIWLICSDADGPRFRPSRACASVTRRTSVARPVVRRMREGRERDEIARSTIAPRCAGPPRSAPRTRFEALRMGLPPPASAEAENRRGKSDRRDNRPRGDYGWAATGDQRTNRRSVGNRRRRHAGRSRSFSRPGRRRPPPRPERPAPERTTAHGWKNDAFADGPELVTAKLNAGRIGHNLRNSQNLKKARALLDLCQLCHRICYSRLPRTAARGASFCGVRRP